MAPLAVTAVVVLAALVLLAPMVSSLRFPLLRRRGAVRASPKTPAITAATIEPSQQCSMTAEADTKNLCFVGETSATSEPALLTDPSLLRDFFSIDEHRNLLLSEAGNIRMNGDLVEIDCFIGFRRGLQICSTTIIDAQINKCSYSTSRDQHLPSYCFELVDSKLSANGMKPLVWLFERLVSSETQTVSTRSTTMVTCAQTSPDKLAFTTNARIEVSINVPSCLARFANSRTIEAQGNQAMQRFLEREVEPSLRRFRDAYCDFAATNAAVKEPLLAGSA